MARGRSGPIAVAVAVTVVWAVAARAAERPLDEPRLGIDFTMASLLAAPGALGAAAPVPGWSNPTTQPAFTNVRAPSVAPTAYLGGRFALTEDLWLRLGFTLGYRSDSDTAAFDNNDEELATSGFSLGLDPGVEFVVARYGRVRAVVGGFLTLGISSAKTVYSYAPTGLEQSVSLLGGWVGLVPMGGVQVRLLDGLYLGAEYRWRITYGFLSGSSTSKANNAPNVSHDVGGSEITFAPAAFALLASFRF